MIWNSFFVAIIALIIFSCQKETAQSQNTEIANVTVPGTLNIVAKTYLSTVTNLTVTGNIDARDFKTMRDSMPKLDSLNLSSVKIVAYIGTFGTYEVNNFNYPANEIPEFAFSTMVTNQAIGKKTLTSITLPNNIISIGNSAFYGCTGLTGILTIPDSVTIIHGCAFCGCTGFKGSLIIPSSVDHIEDAAFESCTGFTGSLILPIYLSYIGSAAFESCTSLTSIITLDSVPVTGNSIGFSVFLNDKAIKNLYVPSGSINAYKAAPQWNSFDIVALQ